MRDPVQRFVDVQARLLAANGTVATSRYLSLPTPALQAHVLDAGSGPPLLLIHGGNSVAVAWQPLLGDLARAFHVFAPDRPGCGLTDKVDYRGVDLRQHAVDFIASTLDALGLDRVHLVGNSMGGYWSLAFALARPERVSKLVLIGEPAGSAPRPPIGFWLLRTPGVNRLLYATKLRPSPRTIRASYQSRLVAHIERVSPLQLELAYAAAVLPGAQRSWLSMLGRGISPWGSSTMTYTLRPELRGLNVPTLFVWGEHDRFGPPTLGHEMAALIPQGRAEVVPDAGHLVWMDQPNRTTNLVLDFLRVPVPR